MTTAEALCYGLARRYDPFMVNNVTGFIGPETHRDNFEMVLANLQDHLHGQTTGAAHGHGAVLHAALEHHARRPADRHATARPRPGPTTTWTSA